jgi:hypothetical protein
MVEDNIRCFVIMPFSSTEKRTEEEWTRHFEKCLKPIIEEIPKVEAFRSSPLREDVQEAIIKDLIFSEIVVADLTDCKPNVFWELGVRQSFKHGTVTIAQKETKIPFHLDHKSIIWYKREPSTDDEFKKDFKKAIVDCLENKSRTDSPVLNTINGRNSIYVLIHRDENIKKVKGVLQEIQYNGRRMIDIKERLTKGDMIQNLLHIKNIDDILSQRYLDKDDGFYDLLFQYSTLIILLNSMIEKWIIKNQPDQIRGINGILIVLSLSIEKQLKEHLIELEKSI